MPKIVCKEKLCQHYCCDQCSKESIKVSKKAFCHSFDGRNDSIPLKGNNEYGAEFAEEPIDKGIENHNITCEAKNCVSNQNGYCIKNCIEVRNRDYGAKCVSYQER